MRLSTRGGLCLAVLLAAGISGAQDRRSGADIPERAVGLEGLPGVQIDTSKDRVTRRELDAAEAARHRLTVRIDNGRFYWTSRDNRLLTMTPFNDFTYLSSGEPGRYVRIRRLNDTWTYVEHVDTALGSVTYWGELRIVLGK